jgi:hypothetical protein
MLLDAGKPKPKINLYKFGAILGIFFFRKLEASNSEINEFVNIL